jgi:hypothetical protein
MGWRGWHVRKVPKAAVSNCSKTAALFDHLVGEREQLVRDADAKRLGGLHIDHEFKPDRLLDRQIGGLGHR